MSTLLLRRLPIPAVRFVPGPARLTQRLRHALLLAAAVLCALAPLSVAQATTPAFNASVLKPPPGARVAIVEFDDMECPACAHANPILKEAAAKYKIPWIRHDFLIPFHQWSPSAAINARWFDTKSKELGNEYRDAVFADQPYIFNLMMLNRFTQNFAQSHHIALPFAIDPEGKLAAEVQADNELGKRLGINLTPTIYIVIANSKGAPYIKVDNPDQDLYRDIDEAFTETR